MKKKLIFLAFLFIIFFIIIAVYYFILTLKAKEGVLKILTYPNSEVYLDGKKSGKTPFEKKLKVGEYLVKLDPQKQSTLSASYQTKITINDNTISFIEREFGDSDITSAGIVLSMEKVDTANKTGVAYVESEPVGAIVALDNVEEGITPITLRNIEVGNHELSIYTPGFIKKTQKIKIVSGYRLNAVFKLVIDPSFVPIDTGDIDNQKATESATIENKVDSELVQIKETETGWLRVRDKPTTFNSSESARVNPGDQFVILEKNNGWYKIEYEKGLFGWISSRYTEIISPTQ